MEQITRMPLGALASNCYIIAADNKEAIVIDPASSAEVLNFAELNGLKIGGIIITHGHYDHFAGVSDIRSATGAKVYAPDLDREMLASAEKSWAWFMQGTEFKPVVPDKTFSDGDKFSVCGVEFRAMNAPGHTAGSCLLFCEKLNVIFTGDVIFEGSVGRTDGFSGSSRAMQKSLSKISALKGNYRLLCGHGDETTLNAEKNLNPYLNEL